MGRFDRVREFLDRLHPAGLLYSTYEHRLLAELDESRMPRHIAVLADGNRRWARANAPGEPLEVGYRAGARRLVQFADWCDEVGVAVVTLWVLSTDNLERSQDNELGPLLEIIAAMVDELAANGRWGVRPVGALELLPTKIRERLDAAAQLTADVDGMQINVAVSYGGRYELRDAVRSLLADKADEGWTIQQVAESLDMDEISSHLYTRGQPDPDLIIRTSGEQRLSGFLMWQSAHSEFYFCEALWPDFRKVDFIRALRAFEQRERRYGR